MSADFTDDLGLQEYNDGVLEEMSENLQYPCVVIDNINSVKIVEYIAETCGGDIPLYVKLNDAIVQIGFTDLKVGTILRFKVLSDKFDVKLHVDKNVQVDLTLTDPTTFTKLLGFAG